MKKIIAIMFSGFVACLYAESSFCGEYHGDRNSFITFTNKYSKDWPIPETIDYYDTNGTKEHVIRYAHWIPSSGKNIGVVVHFNGRTEFIEKNIYTYIDLLNRGFEVWAFDWRGQGFSQRQIVGEKKQMHEIDTFDTYIKDVNYFILNFVRLSEKKGTKVLLAHSMGGQIALRYLLENPSTFDYAVLSSPLLRLPGDNAILGSVNLLRGLNGAKIKNGRGQTCAGLTEIEPKIPVKDKSMINDLLNKFKSITNDKVQDVLQDQITDLNAYLKQRPELERFYKSMTWSSYFIKDNSCELIRSSAITDDSLDPKANTKNYSNDLNKTAEIDCLIKSSIDANGIEKPDLRLACVTDNWLSAAFISTDYVIKHFNDLKTPTLIVRTFPDTAVDNDGQTQFCKDAQNCKSLIGITKVDGVQTGHELLVETQPIRKLFFDLFDEFVKKNK